MRIAYRWWLGLAGAAALAGCERADVPAPAQSEAPAVELPAVDPPLDRAGLLGAVALAASDYAAGRDDRERQQTLAGRRFEVRLRFGCTADTATRREWSFDEDSRVLRVSVEPDLADTEAIVSALGLEDIEAVEGFWVRRPWLLDPACPAGADETPAPDGGGDAAGDDEPRPARSDPTRIGLAHFFTEQDSRTLRRDERAYEATVQLADGELPSARGYDLVLSGRLARLPGGRVIACFGEAVLAPPTCIVSAEFDHVEMTRPDGTRVAQWSSG